MQRPTSPPLTAVSKAPGAAARPSKQDRQLIGDAEVG